jgi:hypothetical protein
MPHLTPSSRPSFASLPRDLRDDAMCTTRRRSFASFEPKLGNSSPTCFAMKQATGCWCVSSQRLHLLIGFEAQTNKSPPTWFWGSNQETVMVILRPKSPNRQPWFWDPKQETFVVVLRPNHWQTIATNVEANPETSRFSSSPRVWCGSHTTSPILSIVRPSSTRFVLDYPRYSASSLLFMPRSSSLPAMLHLPPTHHETSNYISPN